METLKKIVEADIGAKIENLGFDEDWTITLEMFPEVNIHIAYSYFGDEFGDGITAEFKCYFSGERAMIVPGEDSITYVDIIFDFIERMIKQKDPFEKSYNTKTDLMKKVLTQRLEPFTLLKDEDQKQLASFLGAKVWNTGNGWRIKKEIFPEIYIELTYNAQEKLDIAYTGVELSKKVGSYHMEFLGIFLINHILRYITLNNLEKELPDICYIMFSRYYTKMKDWKHNLR
ncbi:MAG: hypothetical protein KGD70_05770 [Candidatus Lokiarchaeota archaeon]|jgi:hypothetical protein|nr:hypothetical protein [Candidatus Lokiarchaeota archaeon]